MPLADQRPHLGARVGAVADREGVDALAQLVDQGSATSSTATTTDTAMQRWPADP
jgi:hypothetical protein